MQPIARSSNSSGAHLLSLYGGGHLGDSSTVPVSGIEWTERSSEALGAELARTLERVFASSLGKRLESLCIIPGQQCWTLYVDCIVLDAGGGLLDAVVLAARSALLNARIPKVRVVPGEKPGELELELGDDAGDLVQLDIGDLPLCVSLYQVGRHHIVDATVEEELCANARLMVAVNRSGKICMMQKGGAGAIDPSTINELLKTAQQVGRSIIDSVDVSVLREAQGGAPKQMRPIVVA